MYKVVRNINGQRLSAFASGGCQVVYPIGELVRAHIPGSKLFAFDSLYTARFFLSLLRATHSDRTFELWEVASETPSIEPHTISIYTSDYQEVANFWKGYGKTKKPPMGTVWLDSLIMVKEVKWVA